MSLLPSIAPALAFLLAAVPLAALLDRVGFFDAVIAVLARRRGAIPVGLLWVVAGLTTAVLNLDTTIVLLTPLYLRLAGEDRGDRLALVSIPLFAAAFASSVLPVSNLTTLIAAERTGVGTVDVLARLALPSAAATLVGALVHGRRHRLAVQGPSELPVDVRALRIGGAVVVGLLVGFVIGPVVGAPAWAVAVVADVALIAVTRSVPWREVPLLTAGAVAAAALLVGFVWPDGVPAVASAESSPAAIVGAVGGATLAANVVNNLPAVLLGFASAMPPGWVAWGWLLGVNVGSVLLPIGSLANILWRRILRAEGIDVSWGAYLRLVVPVGLAALLAATLVLVAERMVLGP